MKIVFTTQGPDLDSPMDARFGRARYFLVLDSDSGAIEVVDNGADSQVAHGAGPKAAQKVIQLGAGVVVTGNGPGGNAASVLGSTDIEVYVGAGNMTAAEAKRAYENGELRKF